MYLLRVAPVRLLAPAKVNLALHVVGQRSNGYHDIESLITFARDAADHLNIRVSPTGFDTLSVTGRFADAVPTSQENILLRALDFARRELRSRDALIPPLAVDLEKNLPVASGIGGGSADAAAFLNMIGNLYPRAQDALVAGSEALGADVPMCVMGVPAMVSGLGERVAPAPQLPLLPMLLVNPGVPVSTPAIFAAIENRHNPPLTPIPIEGFDSLDALVGWLKETRNDLEPAATKLVPAILDVKAMLLESGASFCRMSGSGATVFALFKHVDELNGARRRIAMARRDWWISGASLSEPGHVVSMATNEITRNR